MAALRASFSNLFRRNNEGSEEQEVAAEAEVEEETAEEQEVAPEKPKRRGKKDRTGISVEEGKGNDDAPTDDEPTEKTEIEDPDASLTSSVDDAVAEMNPDDHLDAGSEEEQKDKGFLKRLAEDAGKRAKNVGDRVLLLRDMLEMHVKGVHQLKSWEVGIIVSCLVYVLNPIDVILDAMPGGFLDDVVVLGAAVHRLDASIKTFQKWKQDNPEEFEKGKTLAWFGNKSSGDEEHGEGEEDENKESDKEEEGDKLEMELPEEDDESEEACVVKDNFAVTTQTEPASIKVES